MPRYDVILMGFPEAPRVGGTPAQALAKVFGVPLDVAEGMLKQAPSIVKAGVDEMDARRYYHAFSYIGADCRFREVQPVAPDSLRLDVDSGPFVRQMETDDVQVVSAVPVPVDESDPWARDDTRASVADEGRSEPVVDLESAADDFDDWDPWSDSGVGTFDGARDSAATSAIAAAGTGTIIDVVPDREKLLRQLEAVGAARPGTTEPPETQKFSPSSDAHPDPPADAVEEPALSTPDSSSPAPALDAQSPDEDALEATPAAGIAGAELPAAVPARAVPTRTAPGMRASDWVDELISGAHGRTVRNVNAPTLGKDTESEGDR